MQSTAADKDELLAASSINQIRIHTADAGASGTANEVSGNNYAPATISLAAPSAGTGTDRKRNIASAVTISGPVGTVASHYSLWANGVFRRRGAFDSPATFNADGLIRIPTTFAIVQSDPT